MNATNRGKILNALQNYTGPASMFEDVLQSECNLVCVLQDNPSMKTEQGKCGQLRFTLKGYPWSNLTPNCPWNIYMAQYFLQIPLY